jgi:acyl-CoA thioester hydrolase
MSSPDQPYRATVPPDWIDYNGHMNVAYYVLAFDRATDRLLDHLGLGEAYRRAANCSIFALEAHICYLSELRQGDEFAIATRLIDADRKRLHLFHAMTKTGAESPAATIEAMALHVDLRGPKSAPIGDDAFAKVEALLAQHRRLPDPPQLGHRIAIPR